MTPNPTRRPLDLSALSNLGVTEAHLITAKPLLLPDGRQSMAREDGMLSTRLSLNRVIDRTAQTRFGHDNAWIMGELGVSSFDGNPEVWPRSIEARGVEINPGRGKAFTAFLLFRQNNWAQIYTGGDLLVIEFRQIIRDTDVPHGEFLVWNYTNTSHEFEPAWATQGVMLSVMEAANAQYPIGPPPS